jgi:hypothetical protein
VIPSRSKWGNKNGEGKNKKMKNYAGASIASDSMDYNEPTEIRQGLVSQASDVYERLDRLSRGINMIDEMLFGESSESMDPKDGGSNNLERLLSKSHCTLNEIEERVQNIVERLK